MIEDELRDDVQVVLCPPFIHLPVMYSATQGSQQVSLGAQNCNEHAAGAYTGEIAANMLASIGVTYVILGHSERREYYGESNELLAKKINGGFGSRAEAHLLLRRTAASPGSRRSKTTT